ncbi:MAG TPA: class I SAM-dependent methyltransferase [Solirubrobacteraceae bacterium]|jgi:predicted O-methyltransferase YrrM|nr:class I SAM-dependent methyltransferase [Solirubrobacteraceae bacterium]
MDQQLRSFLGELHRRGRDHDAGKQDRLERLRNLEPDTAALLAVLVRSAKPRRMLELGTSNGYSTVWLADAARAVGAALVSVELDPARTEQARRNLGAAGLEDWAELRSGDAALALASSADDEWGLIFLDAERSAYPSYWPDLVRALAPGGLLVVDNAISHAEEMSAFRAQIAAEPRVLEALVPIGAGALLVVKEPARPSGS